MKMGLDNKVKHLEFIQDVISRMARNSFLLKGWSVLLTTALFTFSAQNLNYWFNLLALFPAIVFWGLDGCYLSLERRYRKLYDKVRTKDVETIDFSMSIKDINDNNSGWFKSTISKSVAIFHCAIILVIFLMTILQFIINRRIENG